MDRNRCNGRPIPAIGHKELLPAFHLFRSSWEVLDSHLFGYCLAKLTSIEPVFNELKLLTIRFFFLYFVQLATILTTNPAIT